MKKIFITYALLFVTNCECATPVSGFFVGTVVSFTNTRVHTKSTIMPGKISMNDNMRCMIESDVYEYDRIQQNVAQIKKEREALIKEKDIGKVIETTQMHDKMQGHYTLFNQLRAHKECVQKTKEVVLNNNGYDINLHLRYNYVYKDFLFTAGVNVGWLKRQHFNLTKKGTNNVFRLGEIVIKYDKAVEKSCCDFQVKTGGFNTEWLLGVGKTNGMFFYNAMFLIMLNKLVITYMPRKYDKEPDAISTEGAVLYRTKDMIVADDIGLIPADGKTIRDCMVLETAKGEKMQEIQSWKKSKVCVSFGVGAEMGMAIARNMVIGIGVAVYPANTASITVPGYKGAMLHDIYQFGAKHKVKLQTLKMYVFFLYKPNFINKAKPIIKHEQNCKHCSIHYNTKRKKYNFKPI